jgi:glutamate racemase
MASKDAPIVVLDSGLGGLTVVQALHRALPREQIVYFGDTARLPYGSKTTKVVTLFVRQIINYLLPLEPKHVVIACNTASALALPAVCEVFPELEITGVVEPGAGAAISAAGGTDPVIGVIGTEATVRSRAYVAAIQRHRPGAKVICRATPLLVPIIEEGRTAADPVVRVCLEQYLRPILDQQPEALVLGCTHYPILRDLITEIAGEGVAVIDSAAQTAQDVRQRLGSAGKLRGAETDLAEMLRPADMPPLEVSPHPWLRCFVTDDSPRFATLASRFLGITVRLPEVVLPDVLYASMNVAVAGASPI